MHLQFLSLDVSGGKRQKKDSTTAPQLEAFRNLSRDDLVSIHFEDEVIDGDIFIVDRFRRKLTIKVDGRPELLEVPAEALIVTDSKFVKKFTFKLTFMPVCYF